MDERIRKLKTTTFLGQRLTRRQIADIQSLVTGFPDLSLRELGHTVCECLDWRTPGGENRIHTALGVLEALEAEGLFALPRKDSRKARTQPQRRPPRTARGEPGAPVTGALAQRMPLRLRVADSPPDVADWNELVDRYHPLGYRRPLGSHLRYFVEDALGQRLGCLLFQFATRRLPPRDAFIGWDEKARRRRLDQVLNNSRFLILPWVQVKNLASKTLALAAAQLPDDWELRHGVRPRLLETFVDESRFRGSCYRAAGWQALGPTRTRPVKQVRVKPLQKDFRDWLCHGRAAARRRREPPGVSDAFRTLWRELAAALLTVSADFDARWQQRRRRLGSLLVALFIFRLVLAGGRQGYATTLAELWAQCQDLELPLPQPRPVSPSALTQARAKIDPALFRALHAEVLRRCERGRARHWKGHRLFAVDGSKLNLPRPLAEHGYPVPAPNAHYPQGLLSCLYRLRTRVPVDFDLHRHADERRAALPHLDVLRPGDVVVYDRGYFSEAFLREHVARGLHPVFRLKRTANRDIRDFAQGPGREAEIVLAPNDPAGPLRLRLVKYRMKDSEYLLGTTLLDSRNYSLAALADLYHERWGIEELFKTSKQTLAIESFHARTERGVRQELFAHFVLITLVRLFTGHGEAGLERLRQENGGGRKKTLNVRHALTLLGQNLTALLLQQAQILDRFHDALVQVRAAIRPGRAYPRVSHKPTGKWKPEKAAKAFSSA